MWRSALIAVKLAVITLVVLGLLYPLAMTGLAQIAFHGKANGSLIQQDGQVVGSKYIGQQFAGPQYFHPRPSAAGDGYDPLSSGASNLGPTNVTLIDRIRADVANVLAEDPGLQMGKIPVDMVTASGSGLDPDITPANAEAQASRVATARNMNVDDVMRLVRENTAGRDLGFLGEKRVNVLELNLALDRQASAGSQ
ncbi:MAG: potassium-transporting ATPase subunit KdpC [Dehalococcoidia bacterium]|jgi:K+-transporting ATPase ATPase C chain